jgi:hypothetical protein
VNAQRLINDPAALRAVRAALGTRRKPPSGF